MADPLCRKMINFLPSGKPVSHPSEQSFRPWHPLALAFSQNIKIIGFQSVRNFKVPSEPRDAGVLIMSEIAVVAHDQFWQSAPPVSKQSCSLGSDDIKIDPV
jgi:hypothetical protein